MAKIIGGLMGTFRGKLGDAVGSAPRGVQTVRTWVNPDNTETVKRAAKRERWRLCAQMAVAATPGVLRPFVSPFLSSMSGFNWFMQQNLSKFANDFELETVRLTFGQLHMGSISSAALIADEVQIVFDTLVGGNGLASDVISGCCYDSLIGRLTMADSPVNRDNGLLTVTLPTGHSTYDYCFAYVFPARYTAGTQLTMVGQSQGFRVSEV